MNRLGLFDSQRTTIKESIRATVESLREHGARHDHWAVAYSGGKDSTTVATLAAWLVQSGKVAPPKRLTVLFADTRLELPPLMAAARGVIELLRQRGCEVRTVMAPLDKRFLVYVLGRGVPPPNNNTFRWCTRQIKVDPMREALDEEVQRLGTSPLVLTGVRLGESAARDARIAVSCSLDGTECGQGRYSAQLADRGYATLDPILHWRVCHVWEWLRIMAPSKRYGAWPTAMVADAYGGDEAEEVNARTGCVGCPLANRDTALDSVLELEAWRHLAPLKELRPLWRELRKPQHRLRQPGGERRQDGSLSKSQNRMGPLKLSSRQWALGRVLEIQVEVNALARSRRRPEIDLLNAEEEARIRELISSRVFPQKWTGNELGAEEPYDAWSASGQVQPWLFGE